jgi:hypothetical protein
MLGQYQRHEAAEDRPLFLPEAGMSSLDKLAWEQKADEVFSMLLKAFVVKAVTCRTTQIPRATPQRRQCPPLKSAKSKIWL